MLNICYDNIHRVKNVKDNAQILAWVLNGANELNQGFTSLSGLKYWIWIIKT